MYNNKTIAALTNSSLLQDRLPGDKLSLPNNLEDIKISVNDFAVAKTINYTLEKIYNNWLYLISYSMIGSNNIPSAEYYTNIIADIGSGPSWTNQSTFSSISSISTGNSLDNITNIIKIDNVANNNNYNIIACSSTTVTLLSGTGTTAIDIIQHPITNQKSNNNITHPSNGILFQGISDVVVSDNNYMYISDKLAKNITKHDISGMLTLDPAILKNNTPGRLMTKIVGGPGDIESKTKFSNNISMVSVDNILYVLDYDEAEERTRIKSYDSELNWKSSTEITSHITSAPVDITYCNDRFYIMCHDWSYTDAVNSIPELLTIPPELLILDNKLEYKDNVLLFDTDKHNLLIGSEKHRCIHFSKQNPNIFYLITNKNVYKKYISRPTEFIGRFLIEDRRIGSGDTSDTNFTSAHIGLKSITTPNGDVVNKDEIILYESNYNIVHKFLEDSAFENSIEDQFDTHALDLSQITIKENEFINAVVYNKTISKVIYNNLLILENVSRRFVTKYDDNGFSKYIGFRYLHADEIANIQYVPTLDNFIGINEIVLSSTINRCVDRIYKLQLEIQKILQEKSINVFPLTTQTVDLVI